MGGESTAASAFPLAYAQTQRFSLGVPRSFTVTNGGTTVLFLRSKDGLSGSLSLWSIDAETGQERLLVDPSTLQDGAEELTVAERARRERARESAGGIVRFAVARSRPLVVFTVSGSIYIADATTGQVRQVGSLRPAFDPRLSPDGRRLAYVHDSALRVVSLGSDPGLDRDAPVSPTDPSDTVSWGLAEFVAGEEMGRTRGFWWSPDGEHLLAARVDVAAVPAWFISDPAQPASPATEIRYPAAGSTNASVQLFRLTIGGEALEIDWRSGGHEYLADVIWTDDDPLLVTQSRDQRTTSIVTVDGGSGRTVPVRAITDAHWTELHPGAPRVAGGALYTIEDLPDRRALCIDGSPVTEAPIQVRSLVSVDDDGALITASLHDSTEVHVIRIPADGWAPEQITSAPGVHACTASSGTMVVSATESSSPVTSFTVHRNDSQHTVRNLVEDPWLRAEPEFLSLGTRSLASAIFLPSAHDGESPLPVLLDPYGGPHAQRVLKSHNPHLVSRWFAEHGFAVLVTDGRGTPGRGPAFEREVWGDLATPVLTDQIDALDAAAERYPFLDLNRVGIRGWSFGGYLAALAAIREPDRIHAAIAGAPVTDWGLYDTHYTERYLGHPDEYPGHYEASSLLNEADDLRRPLLLIHGLADDNVVAAHTLQLSSALLANGRAHQVLPLSGVTHMTPQAVVAQNLLTLQRDFLTTHLGSAPGALS